MAVADRAPAALDEVFLQPGEYFVGAGCRVRTVLGSCVSITLWHPQRRVGAMSHFLLWSRHRDGQAAAASDALDGRYGNEVLPLMLGQLAQRGVRADECQGKLFGGGNMFPAQSQGRGGVGQRNGSAARQLLLQHGIRQVSESLFGVGHRQIIFDLSDGNVWVRQVRPQEARHTDWSEGP